MSTETPKGDPPVPPLPETTLAQFAMRMRVTPEQCGGATSHRAVHCACKLGAINADLVCCASELQALRAACREHINVLIPLLLRQWEPATDPEFDDWLQQKYPTLVKLGRLVPVEEGQ